MEPFIRQAERLLSCPAPSRGYHTTQDYVVPLVEDLLTINRPATEILTADSDPNVVVGMRPVDGSLLLERAHYVRGWLNANAGVGTQVEVQAKRYIDNPDGGTELVSDQVGQELSGKEYVLVRNGIVEGTYTPGRIYINPLRTRTDIQFTPYQPSAVEEALEAIAAFWETWDRENKVFREGFWTDTLLFLSEIDPGDFQSLLQQFREGGQGYQRSRKPMLVRGLEGANVKAVPLKEPPTELQFQQKFVMTSMLVLGCYQQHPSGIFFPEWQGGSRPALSEHDKSDEVNNARSSGHKVDARQICGQYTQIIREKIHPELIAVPMFGEHDAKAEADLHSVLVKTTHTRNDLRVARQDEPYGFHLSAAEYKTASEKDQNKHDQNPWNLPDSETFMKQAQALAQASADGMDGTTADATPAQAGPAAGAGTGAQPKPEAAAKPAKPKPAAAAEKDMAKGWGYMPLDTDDWQTYT